MNKYHTQVIVGSQWGDEGKGKITDFLAQSSDVVIRYQGGNNAGHTVIFDQKKFALKHIPSGIFNPKTINIMAQGMVINPGKLLEEIKYLQSAGVNDFQLFISDRAHVVFPYHLDLDIAMEKIKQDDEENKNHEIGTTKNGIGPAYEDKYARLGIRFGDFINPSVFKALLKQTLAIKNRVLIAFNQKPYDVETLFQEYKHYAQQLTKYVTETGSLIEKLILEKKHVLFEGAQGVMLCIDNGSYPYVTSSSPTASAVALGAGINSQYLSTIHGVVKAYTTRVGSGALPTELDQTTAHIIRERGHEYGTVTKRPRRIGWLDTVVLRYAKRVSGLTSLTITLLDVLDEFDEIKICTAYLLNGQEIDYIPSSDYLYRQVKPQYITLKGWKSDLTDVKSYTTLPINAKKYLKKISELVGLPVTMFSIGPDRKQTIEVE